MTDDTLSLNKKLRANIPKLYGIKFFRWFLLTMPIIVPFYESCGLDTLDIMTLTSIFSIATLLLEIPSGYLGDVVGRKNSMIIGYFFILLGFLFYSFSYSFLFLLGSALTMGIGASFVSGSDSALLYDSLLFLKEEDAYTKIEGRTYAISNFSESAAGIFGAFLATYSLRWPFYAQTFLAFCGLILVFSLYEAPKLKSSASEKSGTNVLEAIKYSFLENKKLRAFITLSSVMGASTLTMAWFAQPYFGFAEIPLIYYGVLWAMLNFVVGVFSWLAHSIEGRYDTIQLCFLITVVILFSYLGISFSPAFAGIAFIFLLYAARGLASPIFKNLVNQNSPSAIRATILSIRNFCIRSLFAILAPIMGYLTDLISIQEAMFLAFVVFLCFSSISLLLVWKAKV